MRTTLFGLAGGSGCSAHDTSLRAPGRRTLRAALGRLITSTLLLGLAQPAAADFWAHRIESITDMSYGSDPAQVFDMHLQGARIGEPNYFERRFKTPGGKDVPVLVWIHGGGWIGGDKASQAAHFMPFLEAGYHVANVNYRQGPNTAPRAVDDAMCAYREVVNRLQRNGNDATRIVVGGASAGGHLALLVGLLNTSGSHDCRAAVAPRVVLNWYGISDIASVDAFLHETRPERNYARSWAGSPAAIASVARQASPINFLGPEAPAIFTVHGKADTVVPFSQATALHDKLQTPNALLPLVDGTHGGFSDAQYQRAYKAIFRFLRRYNR